MRNISILIGATLLTAAIAANTVVANRNNRREARILISIAQRQQELAQNFNERLSRVESLHRLTLTKKDDNYSSSWDRLISQIDPENPGRGIELYTNTVRDEAMAYGSIAYAAAKRGQEELAKRAADWLMNNPYRSVNGAIGWGLSFAWDAFQDGTENPKNAIYGITVAFAAQGLVEVYNLTKDRKYLDIAERSLMDYAALAKIKDDNSTSLPYSDQINDRNYEVYNVSVYIAGQMKAVSYLTNNQNLNKVADKAMSSVLNQSIGDDKSIHWPYSDFNINSENDTLHAAFFVSSLSDAKLSADIIGRSKNYLDRTLKDGRVLRWPVGHSHVEEPGSAWDLGSLLFALCKSGNKQEAELIYARNKSIFFDKRLHIRALGQALMAVAECDLK